MNVQFTEFVSKSFDPNKSALSVHYLAQSAAKTDSSADENLPSEDHKEMGDYRAEFVRNSSEYAHEGDKSPKFDQEQIATNLMLREPERQTLDPNRELTTIIPPHGPFDFHRLTSLTNHLHSANPINLTNIGAQASHLPYAIPFLLSHRSQHPSFASSKTFNSPRQSPVLHQRPSPPSYQSNSPRSSPPHFHHNQLFHLQHHQQQNQHSPNYNTSQKTYQSEHNNSRNVSPNMSPSTSPCRTDNQFEDEEIDVDIEAPPSPHNEEAKASDAAYSSTASEVAGAGTEYAGENKRKIEINIKYLLTLI